MIPALALAPVCARCRTPLSPQHVAGGRGTCPQCGPVEVIQMAVAAPLALVPTFPEPPEPPRGMALERSEPPPPPAPVEDGPFRTAGKLRVERRAAGALRIRLPRRHVAVAVWAVIAAMFIGLIGSAAGGSMAAPLVFGAVAAALGALVLRRRSWIELSPSSLWVQDGDRVVLRLDRARITHIRCATTNPFGAPSAAWDVWVTADGIPTPLVTVSSLEHATAIAELLVHELGLPTWVQVPLLPGMTVR